MLFSVITEYSHAVSLRAVTKQVLINVFLGGAQTLEEAISIHQKICLTM